MSSRRRGTVRFGLAALLLALFGVLAHRNAAAQARPGRVGVGGQIGDPSGLSIVHHVRPRRSYDVLAAWNVGDFALVNVHRLRERPFDASPLTLYYGPGVVAGVESRRDETALLAGASLRGGVHFYVERFEVYLQLTPRLDVLPAPRARLGGGVGLRYFVR